MDMSPREYQDYVKNLQKKSPLLKDMALAFAIGGAICVIGQLILNGWLMLLPQDDAATATSVSLVFLSALFTGLNLYNKLARFGGAGTLVPITGFANAVASPAIDFRAEGLVTGMAAKMFLIAGPVIVFGTAASVIYGVALWLGDKKWLAFRQAILLYWACIPMAAAKAVSPPGPAFASGPGPERGCRRKRSR